jgi:hypothetical protein
MPSLSLEGESFTWHAFFVDLEVANYTSFMDNMLVLQSTTGNIRVQL